MLPMLDEAGNQLIQVAIGYSVLILINLSACIQPGVITTLGNYDFIISLYCVNFIILQVYCLLNGG